MGIPSSRIGEDDADFLGVGKVMAFFLVLVIIQNINRAATGNEGWVGWTIAIIITLGCFLIIHFLGVLDFLFSPFSILLYFCILLIYAAHLAENITPPYSSSEDIFVTLMHIITIIITVVAALMLVGVIVLPILYFLKEICKAILAIFK